jgi:hypothetical protein
VNPVRRFVSAAVTAALALLMAGDPSSAQEERRSEAPARATEDEEAARRAATTASQYEALGLDAPATYQEVLADPDNVGLNLRYAKTQVARGELLGASATVERVLMVNPALPPVRLLYAVILTRLERFQEAEQELRLLAGMDLPPAIRADVERHLHDIRLARRRTRYVASVTTGFQWDSNRNSAASSKERLLNDARLPLTGSSRPRRDTSWVAIHGLDVVHDLGAQAGHELFGGFDYYLGEQTVVDDQDLQSFSLEGGLRLKTEPVRLAPSVAVNHVFLSRETYFRSQRLQLRTERQLIPPVSVFAEGGWTHEDFSGITENTTASERKGERVAMGVGGSILLTPTMQLALEAGYDIKNAKAAYYAYESASVSGTHTWILPKAQFLLTTLECNVDNYEEADAAISARTRRDKQLRARVTYGLPASLLIPDRLAPEGALDNLDATVSFEQTRSLSNVLNYTYSNSRFTALITKRMEF